MFQTPFDFPAVIAAFGRRCSADVVGREAGIGTGCVVGGRAAVGRGAGGSRRGWGDGGRRAGRGLSSVRACVDGPVSERGRGGPGGSVVATALMPAPVRAGGRAGGSGDAATAS